MPLSDASRAVLEKQKALRVGDYIVATRSDGPIVHNAFYALFGRLKQTGLTAHGFRSSFRHWCGEETHFPREVCEQALAHTVGNAVETAYRRSDALERRDLMDAWTRYCTGGEDIAFPAEARGRRNLSDDEPAAVTRAVRRAIDEDRFPHAPHWRCSARRRPNSLRRRRQSQSSDDRRCPRAERRQSAKQSEALTG